MFRFNLLKNSYLMTKSIQLNQQRNLRQIKLDKKKKKNKMKLVNSFENLSGRFTRTNPGIFLINRFHFQTLGLRKPVDYFFYNKLIQSVRDRGFKRLHNLIIYNEINDKFLRYLESKQEKLMIKDLKKHDNMKELEYLCKVEKRTLKKIFRQGLNYDKNGKPNYGNLICN